MQKYEIFMFRALRSEKVSITLYLKYRFAEVAQLVEHRLPKPRVAGSSPVFRSIVMMILYRIYQFLIMIPLMAVITFVTAILTILVSIIGAGRYWAYVLPKWWARAFCLLSFVRVKVVGRDRISQGQSYVFVANHQGYFDIPLMLTQLDKPNPLVAKKEIQKIPMIRGWMEQLHCVFLDRDDPRQSMECLRQAQELLGQGYSVVIFPEGTRNSGGPLGEFKAGAIRMATRAGVPVVPVCIDGSHLLMKKGSLWIHPAKVNIRILPPISTEGMARDEIRALPEQLRQQISDELDRLRG